MSEKGLDPKEVLSASGTDNPLDLVRLGVSAAREGRFERGLIYLAEAYRRLMSDGQHSKIPPTALSHYGLCLALNKGRTKEAAEFCQLAIDRDIFNPEHYVNLAHVWEAGGSRRKAFLAIDRGLRVAPSDLALLHLRATLGLRRPPIIPFLNRDNPLNKTLGRVRHSLKGERVRAPGKS